MVALAKTCSQGSSGGFAFPSPHPIVLSGQLLTARPCILDMALAQLVLLALILAGLGSERPSHVGHVVLRQACDNMGVGGAVRTFTSGQT